LVNVNATFIAQILNFLFLVFVLAKFAYKPLMKMMEERKNKIAGDLASAKDAITREKQQALGEIRAQVINLSLIAASKIVEQKLGSEEDKKLAGDIVDAVLKQ